MRLFVALLFASTAFAPAEDRIITEPSDLKALSANLPSPSDRILTIRIDNYLNPGQLRITQTPVNLDTIRLQRFSPDSDGVITVDSTFIDVKDFAGVLILKNLAFRLGAKSALIAGSDLNRPNHNLILDSCYLYADSLDGTFLSWQGDITSSVDIRNSWFVARAGKPGTKAIQLASGAVSFSNNLLNFPGTVSGVPITQKFEALSNTVNRVQFSLSGDFYNGAAPSLTFSQNLFAYHGPVNAFGGQDFFVASFPGFNASRTFIQGNRMYSVWKGFDYALSEKGKAGVGIDSLFDGKSETELWDWYTDAKDPSTGMLSGNINLRRYNVLPGRTFVDTLIGSDSIRVNFKSATFPRAFRWNIGAVPDLVDSAYRPLAALPGRLTVGPFQVDNIRDNAIAEYGRPILLVQSAGGLFLPQAAASRYKEPRVFQNRIPSARVFALVDSGNTPRGFSIEPVMAGVEKFEHIRFGHVSGAGETVLKVDINKVMPDSLRYLKRTFAFGTSATVDGRLTFASRLSTDKEAQPWSAQGEGTWFWYWKAKDTLIPATASTIWGDTLVYGSFNYLNKDSTFIAYLVERLSVHAGSTSKPIPFATLQSGSAAGYQLYFDTSTVDPGRFGSATKGYKFAWTGRGANDSLLLILKAPAPGSQVFVRVPTKDDVDSLPLTEDTEGNFKIPIGGADSGKTFFAGVKYNVLAGTAFSGTVNGVSVDSLYSISSGLLAYRDLSQSDAQSSGTNREEVFRNTRYLGGKANASLGLNVTRDYDIAMQISKPISEDRVETWVMVGESWVNVTPIANTIGDSAHVVIRYAKQKPQPTQIVVLERFQAPDAYFDPKLNPRTDSLIFTMSARAPGTPNPVLAYCLDVRTIGLNGELGSSQCLKQDPAVETRIPVQGNTAYAYRIIYYVGADADTVALPQGFEYPAQFGWDVKGALKGNPKLDSLPQGHWSLIAIPAEKNLRQLLDSLPRAGADQVKDTTMVLDFKHMSTGKAEFDSLKRVETVTMGRSVGILLASSHRLILSVDHLPILPRKSPKPETLSTSMGWNLIGNPYPIVLRKDCIHPKRPHAVRVAQLIYDANTAGKYRWDTAAKAIPPFRGIAYYSTQPETLVIDPGDTTPSVPVVALAKAAAGSGRIRVGIESPWGVSGMALVRGAGEYPMRFLPSPSSGLELRVGGDGGFWIKPIKDMQRIDEPVEIRSDREGAARFALGEDEQPPAFALIDEATGAVYDAASARELPVSQGSHTYRLLAGDPSFVGEGTRAFLAAVPAATGLSQNFPNPARGLTRIAIDWPATQSRDRRATLEVLDLRGRRIALRRLEDIHVGRQLLEVDASG
jgi:hypothetical protein